MKRTIVLTTLFLAALFLAAPAAFAERGPRRPDRPRDRKPVPDRMKERAGRLLDPFRIDPSEEYKAEMKRHAEVMKRVMEDLRDRRLKIRESIREEYKNELERLRNENPDAEKPPKPNIKEIIETVRKLYAQDIKAICTRIVDEDIRHSENLLAIKKKDRDRAVENLGKTIGRSLRSDRRPGMDRPPRDRGDRPGRPGGERPGKRWNAPEPPPVENPR